MNAIHHHRQPPRSRDAIPDKLKKFVLRLQLRGQVTPAAICLPYAKQAVDRGWATYLSEDSPAVEFTASGKTAAASFEAELKTTKCRGAK